MEGKYHTAPEINITCPGELKLLQKLNTNKAAGPDNIRPKVLKELAPEIAPIFLPSYSENHWKQEKKPT